MTRRSVLAGGALTVGTVLCAAASCGPITEPPGSPAPVNACAEHPCSGYVQSPAPTCGADGTCATAVPPSGIELVVSLPGDSSFAPGSQYALPYGALAACAPPQRGCNCAWPACGHLPSLVSLSGGYLMSACVQSAPAQCASGLGFFLGNLGSAGDPLPTWLPVHATYRLLKDPWQNDVTGLPLEPVEAAQVINNFSPYLGPFGDADPIAFQVNLPQGTYERTVAPVSAYDVVFGPQVSGDVVASNAGPAFEQVTVDSLHHYDFTSYEPEIGHPTLPTFDIARADGLDGWTAFLRDAKTKRTISNVRPLGGTLTQGVQLVTNHGTADALDGAELVVAPPIGAALPVGVFAPTGKELPEAENYPPLPPIATVTGSVTGPGGSYVAADLVFEALAFTDVTGTYNYLPFEFVGHASARPGQGPGAASTYSVDLPLGPYRVDVRPLDGSAAMQVTRLDVGAQTTTQNFALVAPRKLSGSATLTDGRPLAAATVEAIPQAQGCSTPPALADGGSAGPLRPLDPSAQSCLPRPSQTVTDAQGAFKNLPLDPGGYKIRVRPADGTHLPWVTKDLPAATGDQTIDITVPAPAHASFQLLGADGSVVVHAVVRAFAGAEEIGQTITDTAGTCDLYMALPP